MQAQIQASFTQSYLGICRWRRVAVVIHVGVHRGEGQIAVRPVVIVLVTNGHRSVHALGVGGRVCKYKA